MLSAVLLCKCKQGVRVFLSRLPAPLLEIHTTDIFDILYDNEFVDIFDVFHIQSTHIIYIYLFIYFELAECFKFLDLKSRVS